jgi:hypothetical protein
MKIQGFLSSTSRVATCFIFAQKVEIMMVVRKEVKVDRVMITLTSEPPLGSVRLIWNLFKNVTLSFDNL